MSDPVDKFDKNGLFAGMVAGAIVGAITGFVSTALSNINKEDGEKDNIWAAACIGAATGAATGMIVDVAVCTGGVGGLAIAAFGCGLTEVGSYALNEVANSGHREMKFSCQIIAGKFAIGALSGMFSYLMAGGFGKKRYTGKMFDRLLEHDVDQVFGEKSRLLIDRFSGYAVQKLRDCLWTNLTTKQIVKGASKWLIKTVPFDTGVWFMQKGLYLFVKRYWEVMMSE